MSPHAPQRKQGRPGRRTSGQRAGSGRAGSGDDDPPVVATKLSSIIK